MLEDKLRKLLNLPEFPYVKAKLIKPFVKQSFPTSEFAKAYSCDKKKLVERLISLNLINTQSKNGITLLAQAVEDGSEAIVRLLIDAKAKTNYGGDNKLRRR